MHKDDDIRGFVQPILLILYTPFFYFNNTIYGSQL